MARKVPETYEELVDNTPDLCNFFTEEQWGMTANSNDLLRKNFEKMWRKNVRRNAKNLLDKHGTVFHDCEGLGRNKAIIGIGAGPSFNKNKHVLKDLFDLTIPLPFEEQPFIFIASNHQYKPLLNMGIIPHFVMLCEGSDVVYDQLCTDIPKHGRSSVLICPMRAHYRVLNEWSDQGRSIRFYIGDNEWLIEEYTKARGTPPPDKGFIIPHGGNVTNQMFIVGLNFLKSNVFMCVGNDLSYPLEQSLQDRRNGYYADGDYSSNLGTQRDEANRFIPWMGYELEQSVLDPSQYLIKFTPKATTYQLLLYKNWVEVQIAISSQWKQPFHYYNCSESGILGVMSRKKVTELDKEPMLNHLKDKDNWYMLDEMYGHKYHTKSLTQAASEFIRARETLREIPPWQTEGSVISVAPF